MQHHAVDERHALSETLRCADPDSETLCGDWTTAQLAAHLVLRERSVVELAGRLPVRRLREHAEQMILDLATREPYEKLVDLVHRGPSWSDLSWPLPVAWLWSLPPVREATNLLEYLVHHEDVRRARRGWAPRSLPPDVQDAVWQRLRLAARLTLRSVPVGIALRWPGPGELRTRLAGRGAPTVTITGDPVELAMFTFGRLGVAQVDYAGDPADIAAVRGADISI
ncbi:MAG: hypothetical protein JWP39_73 [Jatrophihabitans sp.]|nr:hypothetical protein [Jatrophihabitans sp.]